jgi:FdhD protein
MADSPFISGTIAKAVGARLRQEDDRIVVEEPLELRLGGTPIAVTMRTPGEDRELAAGFLLTEGIIRKFSDIEKITGPVRRLPNVVSIKLRRGLRFRRDRLMRHFHATSSCGLCGKTTLESIRVRTQPVSADFKVSLKFFYALPEHLREAQDTFEETGGLHAAALFDAEGTLLLLREDVGRHNAVDKLIGAALMQSRFPLDRCILLVSGRASFEILQKALVARVPVVAAVSAPSSLAIALARKFGMTLIGFLRGESCNVYAGAERVDGDPGNQG